MKSFFFKCPTNRLSMQWCYSPSRSRRSILPLNIYSTYHLIESSFYSIESISLPIQSSLSPDTPPLFDEYLLPTHTPHSTKAAPVRPRGPSCSPRKRQEKNADKNKAKKVIISQNANVNCVLYIFLVWKHHVKEGKNVTILYYSERKEHRMYIHTVRTSVNRIHGVDDTCSLCWYGLLTNGLGGIYSRQNMVRRRGSNDEHNAYMV